MQVLHRLTSVLSAVSDHAVAVGQALGGGNFRNGLKDLCNQIAIGGVDHVGAADVRFGYYQNVNGGHGVDVAEGVHPFVFVNLCGGNFPRDDFAKNTFHTV